MKKIWLIVGGVALALVLIVLAVPFLIPASQYRASLEQAATESLGRDVKINGKLRFSIVPTLGLNAKQVTIGNAPGGKAPLFAQIDDLDVGVALGPLMGGKVEVTKLVLKQPIINLEADVAGKPNWMFEPKDEQLEKTAEQKAAELEQLGFGDLRIEDGQLSYRDKQGKVESVSALNANIEFKSINQPFLLASDFTYNNAPVKLALDAPAPRDFAEEKPTAINVTVESDKLTATMTGAVEPKTMAITGKLDARGPSLRDLAAWTGSPLGDGGGFAQFSVLGDLKSEGDRIELSNATIAIDKAKGRGNIVLTARGDKPTYVAANLILDALDVNPYLAAPAAAGATADAAKGVNVQQGWDVKRIDLSGLRAIDGHLVIKTGQLLFQKIKIDRADLDVTLTGGRMHTAMKNLALYGGTGAGVLVLDARGDALQVENQLSVSGIDAKRFLADAIGLDKIEGKAKIDVNFAGSGLSQQSIMDSLGGSAVFNFEDGAIVGVNLAQIARQVQSVLTGQAVGPGAKTDFAEMAATFSIAKGVAKTNDLRMLNPFVRITGQGDINLAQQTLNMKITPRAVKSIEGQGGKQALSGVGVPFTVTGPWAKPKYTADLIGIVQENFSKQIDDFSKNLGGLFGQKKQPAQ